MLETIRKSSFLSSINLDNYRGFLNDLNESVPLLIKDGLEYKFIHKTISEFFAAEFLNYSEISDELFNKIYTNKLEKSFEKSFEFLYKINSSLYIKKIGSYFIKDFITFVDNHRYLNYNKYILNFLFFVPSSFFIVVKKEDVIDKNGRINSESEILRTKRGRRGSYFYVTYQNVEYVIVLTINRYQYFNNNCLIDDLSLKVEDKFCIRDYHRLESNPIYFNSFVNIFPKIVLNEWYDFFDTSSYEINNSDFMTFICISASHIGLGPRVENQFKYIDYEKCRDLLSSIENKISVLD